MIDWGLLVATVIPVAGWGATVENRLRGREEIMHAVEEVNKKVEKLDQRQEQLIDFLLRDRK